MGRGRRDYDDDYDDYAGPERRYRRGGRDFRHIGFGCDGPRRRRPSTQQRIEHLEEVQRDLEEMTADVASRLDWLRTRASEPTTTT